MNALDTLTKRQRQIYDFIADFISSNSAPPTRVEIANHFGFKSPNAAEDHLKALAKKGAIILKTGTSRGISLCYAERHADLSHTSQIPANDAANKGLAVIGDVAAGEPMLAAEHIQQYVNVEQHLFSDSPDFLLKVKGDSMINVGIHEKDLLAIKKTQQVSNNQIVVARIEDDVTVKRYQRKGNRISLIAENDAYAPIEVDLSQQTFAIEGVVVGLIRQQF